MADRYDMDRDRDWRRGMERDREWRGSEREDYSRAGAERERGGRYSGRDRGPEHDWRSSSTGGFSSRESERDDRREEHRGWGGGEHEFRREPESGEWGRTRSEEGWRGGDWRTGDWHEDRETRREPMRTQQRDERYYQRRPDTSWTPFSERDRGRRSDFGTGAYLGSIGNDNDSRVWGRSGSGGSQAGSYSGGMGAWGTGTGGERGRFAGRGPKNYRRADDRIRDDINQRLTDHPDIDASEINVEVREGVAVLTGEVEERFSKRLAEDIAEDVFGVKEVQNQIRVQKHEWSGGRSSIASDESRAPSNEGRTTVTNEQPVIGSGKR